MFCHIFYNGILVYFSCDLEVVINRKVYKYKSFLFCIKMVLYKAYDKLRRTGLGIFGKSPFRKKGYLERLVGKNPAIILDTSAIIDLEADDRRRKNKKGDFFEELDGDTRLFVPEEVYNECIIHNSEKINSHVKEISNESFRKIEKIFKKSQRLFDKYESMYGDNFKYLSCLLAKELQNGKEEISSTDYRLVGRSLELASLEDRKGWEDYAPSYVTVLTSDHHVDDMVKKAVKDLNIPRVHSFLTRDN